MNSSERRVIFTAGNLLERKVSDRTRTFVYIYDLENKSEYVFDRDPKLDRPHLYVECYTNGCGSNIVFVDSASITSNGCDSIDFSPDEWYDLTDMFLRADHNGRRIAEVFLKMQGFSSEHATRLVDILSDIEVHVPRRPSARI